VTPPIQLVEIHPSTKIRTRSVQKRLKQDLVTLTAVQRAEALVALHLLLKQMEGELD